MIEVKDLVKRYGTHLAVDHLSFTVDKGEIVGFLGPNGAGKSTTMNIITGYIYADEGTVLVDGHDIMEEPLMVKKSIGYLPEVPPLYPDMRVMEYLAFTAKLKKVPKKEMQEMIGEIMEMTGITQRSGQLIKHLSKGYKQRAGLAAAIMGFPEVIILDEPTVGLDPVQIIEIRDLIRKLSENHTVILSSHILSEVSAVCDKVMIINKGKLIVSDTPDNLTEHIKGAHSISLQVKGEEEAIEKALLQIEGIKDVKLIMQAEAAHITITSDGKRDIREDIFFALSDIKCPILEMKTSAMSLEDIFLEVTKEDTIEEGIINGEAFVEKAAENTEEIQEEEIEDKNMEEITEEYGKEKSEEADL